MNPQLTMSFSVILVEFLGSLSELSEFASGFFFGGLNAFDQLVFQPME